MNKDTNIIKEVIFYLRAPVVESILKSRVISCLRFGVPAHLVFSEEAEGACEGG